MEDASNSSSAKSEYKNFIWKERGNQNIENTYISNNINLDNNTLSSESSFTSSTSNIISGINATTSMKYCTDLPHHIFYLPNIQFEIKKIIGMEALTHGIKYALDKYTVNRQMIKNWCLQTALVNSEIIQFLDLQSQTTHTPKPISSHLENAKYYNLDEKEEGEFKPRSNKSLNSSNISQDRCANTELPIENPISVNSLIKQKNIGVFSTLRREEKERILYDYIKFGHSMGSRKWGIESNVIRRFEQRKDIGCERGITIWKQEEELIIHNTMNNLSKLGVECIKERIINDLKLNNGESVNIYDICMDGLDKGIGVAAARYQINIFHLEFIIKSLCPFEYGKMEANNWYSITDPALSDKHKLLTPQYKMEIINLARSEGINYASKRYHVSATTVKKYKKNYKRGGVQGLNKIKKGRKPQ